MIIHSFNRSFRHHVSICRHNRQINVQRDDSAFFAARNSAAQQQIKFVHILAKIRGRTGQSACYWKKFYLILKNCTIVTIAFKNSNYIKMQNLSPPLYVRNKLLSSRNRASHKKDSSLTGCCCITKTNETFIIYSCWHLLASHRFLKGQVCT